MSYQLGFEAFIKRFQKRFPVNEFQWEYKTHKSEFTGGFWSAHTNSGSLFLHFSGPSKYYLYRIKQGDKVICEISCDLIFGIRLSVRSPYGKEFYFFRRPLNLCNGTVYSRRLWLKDKPKFGRLGCNLSSHLWKNFNASQV